MLNVLARALPRVPDNRIVAFVIPLVTPPIAAVAGVATTWLAEHAPGVHVNPGQATALGVTVATGLLVKTLALAHDWMRGHHLAMELGAGATGTDPEAEMVGADELPGDREEHADPPPEVVEISDAHDVAGAGDPPRDGPPVQPSQAGLTS